MTSDKNDKKPTDNDLQTESLRRPPVEPPPLAIRVRVLGKSPLEQPQQQLEHRLESGTCVVGSAPDCDLVLANHTTVSRKHLEIEVVPEGARVTDLGSRNGTFYMGQRIERAILAPGAHVVVGDVELALDAEDVKDATEIEPSSANEYRGMIGHSIAMRRLFTLLERLEGSLVNVLIVGESGVGKELVARAIHDGSHVAHTGPFVALNCGALPRELVASELFGHVKGAFTGAQHARQGAFESANGGTLFLDEIGELPLDMQPLLLRALESGEIRPVGSDDVRKVSVRVVSATNRPLEEEVAANRFRQDLYFRLAVVRAHVPPLRSRRDDVGVLVERFAKQANLTIPKSEIERLRGRALFGNVRELRNLVSAFSVLGRFPDELPLRSASQLEDALRLEIDPDRVAYAEQKDRLVDQFTRLYLESLMDRCGHNQSAAAKMAGLNRSYLGELLTKYGLTTKR
jgi:two-component system, NtrC family, response regulator GlrR